MNKKCSDCLYYDICNHGEVCKHFVFFDYEYDNNYRDTDELFQGSKDEFIDEWFEYIKDFE